MAWEWASAASGALVGISGLVAGWRVAVGGRKHDERMAIQRNEHEARVADARWYRDRRAEAYVDLLNLTQRMGQWVVAVHPLWDANPPRPLPDIPTNVEQAQVWAKMEAYGSVAVRAAMNTWRVAVDGAIQAAEAVTRDEDDARRDLDNMRREVENAHLRLGRAISDELGASTLPPQLPGQRRKDEPQAVEGSER